MKITADQLRRIIREEVAAAASLEAAPTKGPHMNFHYISGGVMNVGKRLQDLSWEIARGEDKPDAEALAVSFAAKIDGLIAKLEEYKALLGDEAM